MTPQSTSTNSNGYWKAKLSFFLLLIFFTLNAGFGQNDSSPVYQSLVKKISVNQSLQNADIFDEITLDEDKLRRIQTEVSDAQFFTVSENSILKNQPELLQLPMEIKGEGSITIKLFKKNIFSDNSSYHLASAPDEAIDNSKNAVHYWGVVSTYEENSLAAFSFTSSGVNGMISMKGKTWEFGRLKNDNRNYILYETAHLLKSFPQLCSVEDFPELMEIQEESEQSTGNPPASVVSDNCIRVHLEIDYDIFQNKGGATEAQNYVEGAFSQVAVLYANEGITTIVSDVFVWDEPSPYDGPGSGGYLNDFRDEMNSRGFTGDLAHLVNLENLGGVAWLDVLCSNSFSYAYSGINTSYNDVPTYSWTVNVMAHEMGHNVGSPHTHACAWNGNNTPIDCCGPSEGYNGSGCPTGYDCDIPLPDEGTIMSYCHIVPGVGVDFNEGFHPQVQTLMQDEVDNSSCLSGCDGGPLVADFTFDESVICEGEVVNFTDNSSGNVDEWEWTFEGGTPATSNNENPVVTYNNAGTFDVTLVVTDANGNTSELSLTDAITVNENAIADFDYTISGREVTFINNSQFADSYLWDFGDGNTSTDVNPVHTYSADGTFLVSLTAMNNECGSTTYEESILIETPPIAEVLISPTSGCVPLTVVFDASQSQNTSSYYWEFEGGDPETSTEIAQTVVYDEPGTFDVLFIATNSGIDDTIFLEDHIVVNSATAAAQVINNETCLGVCDGSATASGGTSYLWSTDETTQTISDLCAGTYEVTVTDADGCTDVASVTIEDGNNVSAEVTIDQDESCLGECDGQATASGGSSYEWSDGQTTATAIDLCPGTYEVTVSDENGCTDIASIEVAPGNTINAEATVDIQESCFGACDGVATATGGTNYEWSDGQTTSTAVNLCAGTYEVTVSDGNGCSDVTSVEVEPGVSVVASVTIEQEESCEDACDGVATASGGTQYEWSNGQSGSTASNLCNGIYEVTVSDDNGCSDVATFSIGAGDPVSIPEFSFDTVFCEDDNAFDLPVNSDNNISGSWSGTGVSDNTFDPESAGAGNWTITFTPDAGQCSSEITVTMIVNDCGCQNPVTVDAGADQILCATEGISIQLNGEVSNSPGQNWQTSGSGSFNNPELLDAVYTPSQTDIDNGGVTLTLTAEDPDGSGPCTSVSDEIEVTLNFQPQIGNYDDVESCFEFELPQYTGDITNSVGYYTEAGGNGTELEPGDLITETMTVYVYNETPEGCVDEVSFNVTINGVFADAGNDETIQSGTSTTLMATATGGTGNYTYSWSPASLVINENQAETETENLSSTQTFTVIVTDTETGCINSSEVTIFIEGSPLQGTIDPENAMICTGDSVDLAVNISGGSPPFNFDWESDPAGFNSDEQSIRVSPSESTVYSVTITDTDGSSIIIESTVQVNDLPIADAGDDKLLCPDVDESEQCASEEDNVIYTWWNIEEDTLQGRCQLFNSGIWYLKVTDTITSCVSYDTVNIEQSDFGGNIFSTDESSEDAEDGTARVEVSGGETPYSFEWNTGDTDSVLTNLAPGEYSATVTDDSGCELVFMTVIEEFESDDCNLKINQSLSNDFSVSCYGDCDAEVNGLVITGGTQPFDTDIYYDSTIIATTSEDTISISELCPGKYRVATRDANNCAYSLFFTITEPEELNVELFADSSILITGGVAPYDTMMSENMDSMIVTVTDSNDCVAQDFITTTSSDEESFSEFSIYPNPTRNYLFIESGEIKNYSLEFYDQYGRKLIQAQDERRLDISDYPPGMYYLHVQLGDIPGKMKYYPIVIMR